MRTRIGILYTGCAITLNRTISLLSRKFDVLLIVDFLPAGVKALVIPETEGYNARSGAVKPFRKLPENPLCVDNAFLLNFLDYCVEDLNVAGVKLVAVGPSALTVADRTKMCHIYSEGTSFSLAGSPVMKTTGTYLNTNPLLECYEEVIRFIEDDGGTTVASNDRKPDPVLQHEEDEPDV